MQADHRWRECAEMTALQARRSLRQLVAGHVKARLIEVVHASDAEAEHGSCF